LNLIEYYLTTLWWTRWDYGNEYDSWICLVELHKLECIEHIIPCYNILENRWYDMVKTQSMLGRENAYVSNILEENRKERPKWIQW
jgi:hypothetical protein